MASFTTRGLGVPGRRGPGDKPRRRWGRRIAADERLALVDHLGELRTRLAISIGGFALAFIGAYVVHAQMIGALNGALPAAVPEPITFGVAEPFMTSIKVSMWAALALSLPIWSYQLWAFVAPAVQQNARRTAAFLALGASVLFVCGAAFAYFVALPSAIQFLVGFDARLYDVQIRAKDFYSFAAAVLISMGLVFDLPIVLLGMVRLRVISTAKLRRNRKVAIVSLTALAVVLPGVDPVTTIMELVPLYFLYEGTLFLATRLERRWDAAREAADAAREAEFASS